MATKPIKPKGLELKYLVPTVAADGANVNIRVEGDIPYIHFIQVRMEDNEHVHADVVASVRLHNLAQLEDLAKTIQTTIKQHVEREK